MGLRELALPVQAYLKKARSLANGGEGLGYSDPVDKSGELVDPGRPKALDESDGLGGLSWACLAP